jgi:prepilin-type N-terminal cleavage/methylation domain-containing protein
MYGNSRTNRKASGFTLIELLVVVLILSILMAIAMPLYLSSVSDSQLKTCHANMQTIANAVQAARTAAGTTQTDYSSYIGAVDVTKETALTAVPLCPAGGTYAIAAGTTAASFKITCTATGHTSFEPGY